MRIFNLLKKTSFASAERKNKKQIIAQSEKAKERVYDNSILDMMPDYVVVLNPERQILFVNKSLLDFLEKEDDLSVLGLRPGELLECVHSENNSGGCGTTEFCSVCGAVKSILNTQKNRIEHESTCEINTKTGGAYNFRVWTFPLEGDTLFVMRNIADEVYRNALEHLFFHDLGNIGSGLFGLLDMINGNTETFLKYEKLLTGLAKEILEEVNSQRDLILAEEGTMSIHWETVSNVEIMKFVADMLSGHQVSEGKSIILDQDSEVVDIKTDAQFLKRIIINMTKNALEASEDGECVSLKTTSKQGKVIFEVHNNSFIPKDTQLRIFNRSFSTKGRGRGLGTYSIKLLSENYLQSKASFSSDEKNGTSFFVECPIEPVLEAIE